MREWRDGGAQVHETAEVADGVTIGEHSRVWHQAQIRERATVGRECVLGKGVYVDVDVRIGDRVKIQNGASLYRGVSVADGAFIGPGAILANDRYPRAIGPDGSPKGEADWEVGPVHIGHGASVGAGAIVLPGVTVGSFAVVAAGAVLTRDAPAYGLMVGVPARLAGGACCCGRPEPGARAGIPFTCAACGRAHVLGRSE